MVETRDYFGGIEYLNGNLEAVYHADGRWVDGLFTYTVKDHLGNSRVSFADLNSDGDLTVGGPESEIMQENHYYPFGMNMEGNWAAQIGPNNKYQYNGKELNDEFGLNWLDFGFRWYDPAIGRFPSVDPIIEDFPYLTPYNYASNNPITMIDLWGLQGVDFNKKEVGRMHSYLKQNARNTNRGRGDDCMTCHIKGIEILTDNTIPKGDNSDGKNSINRQRKQMQDKNLAKETQTVDFLDSNGNKARSAGDVETMDGSVAAEAVKSSEGTEHSVFGVSVTDGYHTMTLTVKNEELAGPVAPGSTPPTKTTFTLSDQGTNSGTQRKGNLEFNSAAKLDAHLLGYVKNSSPNHFPAKIELHQIVNPNR